MPRRRAAVKAGLVLFGVFAALVVAESLLRLAGLALEWRSVLRVPPAARGDIRVILCIGESTTAPGWELFDHSWPRQLERILNASGSGPKFAVVNRGLPGASTADLRSRVEQGLARDKPQLVITMMGINDRKWYGAPPAGGGALRRWRLFKVARYFYHEVLHLGAAEPPAGPTMEYQDEIVRRIRESGASLVMMQYPGLELAPLREHFGGLPGVAFVENKPSFDAALSRATYQDYFTDRFAGSWGHCTARGDNLIARNAAAAVLSLTGGARPAKAAAGSAYRRARLFSYDEDEPPPPPAVNDSAVKRPAARREKKRDPRADCLAPNPGVDRAALPPSFFDACLEAFPGEPSLLADRGVALFRLGRRADAEDAFRAAIAAKADYLPAYLSLAAAQEARGFAADALATVETGLAKCPETRDRKAYGQALLLRRRLMTSAKRLK